MKSSALLAFPVVLASLALAGCTGDSAEQSTASAKERLQKNDITSAVIDLKNALQKNPDLAEARYLLGSALLKEGNVVAAEIELRKALAAGHPDDVVVPDLARSMLMLSQTQKVVDEFGKTRLGGAAAAASLQTTLAAAYAALGKRDLAQVALAGALSFDPGYAPALLIGARQKVATQDFAGALSVIEGVIARNPDTTGAWMLKGDILIYALNRPDDAVAAYRKALQIDPKFVAGHLAVVPVLLLQGKLDEGARQLEQLKKLAPNSQRTQYFEAQLAYQRKEFKAARELTRQVLRQVPKNARALQLAGAVELQLGDTTQAEIYLTKAVQLAPDFTIARRLLIGTYLRAGQPTKALAELKSATGKAGVDAAWSSLAGEVYLQNGDARRAEEYFAKALKSDPADARMRTALAAAHLAGGQTELAVGEMESIAGSDAGITADLALISVHMRKREFAKALAAIDKLESKQPGKPLAANLRGRVQLAQGERAAARSSFERALAIDPGYFAAAAILATLDLADKQPEEARKRFERLLANNPKNSHALLALARLAEGRNAGKDEVSALLSNAIQANPTDHEPRLVLIEFFLRSGDTKQALASAQAAVAAMPGSPELLDSLGRVQRVSGDMNQSIATFNKLVALQPWSPQPHVRLAEAHAVAKNHHAAEQSLRKALDIKSDDLDAQRGLITLALQAKRYQDAVTVARTVREQRPKEAVGFEMEGDIAAAQKNWGAAGVAYRSALKHAARADVAIKLHLVLIASGKTAESDQFATTWLKDHPKEGAFLFHLGTQALAREDYAAAERHYLSALRIQPNNALTLHTLARVTRSLGKDGAVAYAEKAAVLAPDQPAFMDTLATLLAERKDYARAIKAQKKALELQPRNSTLRLHLAKVYLQAGDRSSARQELETLAKLGNEFRAQAEVAALLKSL